MTTPDRRADAESRLRRSFASLGGARALLVMQPPSCDDAVNRASAAALHAARALVDSQWAKDSQPGWDPTFRPGMVTRLGGLVAERKLSSLDAFLKLLDRFEALAANMSLPPGLHALLCARWSKMASTQTRAKRLATISTRRRSRSRPRRSSSLRWPTRSAWATSSASASADLGRAARRSSGATTAGPPSSRPHTFASSRPTADAARSS